MKTFLTVALLLTLFLAYGQNELSMDQTELRLERPMSEVEGRRSNGMYRYYAKGSSEPFTGILTANYDSGELFTRQEYVDGVGEGFWINYYKNGQVKEIGTNVQDQTIGPIKKYYEDGVLASEGTYKYWRIKVGVWKYYNNKGELSRTEDYKDKGSLEDVIAYYKRGDISTSWYKEIIADYNKK